MTNMVSVDGLRKQFGHLCAVDDISLAVSRGEVLGFLGPNGSGKSTTMKMIAGYLRPDKGQVRICGTDMLSHPVLAQRHIGFLPEGAPTYSDISTSAYLGFIANIRQMYGVEREGRIDYVVDRTSICEVLHQPIGTLSKGYKRRVGLAQALLHNPDVLILDEPTDGLDPNQKHEIRALIREISRHKAIIISTHILDEVETICDRALIINKGNIVTSGTVDELERQSRYYNAVSLILPQSSTYEARKQLQSLPDIQSVEENIIDENTTELVALANDSADILINIAPMVRQQEWSVDQVRRKNGHLDELFRNVTTTDDTEKSSVHPEKEIVSPDMTSVTAFSQPNAVWAICKNELTHYFLTPVAYVFIAIFLIAMGAFTFFAGGFFTRGQASLEGFFQFHPWLYLFLIPAIAMRLWSEECKSGSIEVLLTLPVTILSAVLGKLVAAWMVLGLALLLTTPLWFSVNYLGSPDNATIAAGYVGSFIMAGSYLAISAFASALTPNQVIAFIIAVATCLLFTASGLGLVLEFFSGWASPMVLDAVSNFSFLEHFQNISRGVVDLGDAVFFISTIVVFVFANVVAVNRLKDG